MSAIVNAKGLACPQPVILTKKALEQHSEVSVLVDNTTAVENVKRFGSSAGCSVNVADEPDGAFRINLKKQSEAAPGVPADQYLSCGKADPSANAGPNVFVIAAETMGKGSDELGGVLMRAFIHTAIELESRPDVMIFYNAGVKYATEGSDVLDDLKMLEKKGVRILVCGTCVNYFGLAEKVRAGVVSNMYDIAGIMSAAGRVVRP